MNRQTQDGYMKLAIYFLKRRLKGKKLENTLLNIQQALIDCAHEYRPGYWRRLRCALAYSFNRTGNPKIADSIKATINPITAANAKSGVKALKKPKQKRQHQVLKKYDNDIRHYLLKKGNSNARCVLAALNIVNIIGCRPIEIMTLKADWNNSTIIITGAKKTTNGLRGLDRAIHLSDKDFAVVVMAYSQLESYRQRQKLTKIQLQSRIQHGLARATAALWPHRKHRITLYSYRHQFASDLKGSDKSREEIAAIMGHQSVDSANTYGDRRYGGRKIDIKATTSSIASVRKTVPKNRGYIKTPRSPFHGLINPVRP